MWHSRVLVHTHTSSYPCTTRQPHANTNTLKYKQMHSQNNLLSMHCHTTLCTHIHTHSWLSMNYQTALRTHIHTHLAIDALQHSTVHAHAHTCGYTCTATQHRVSTYTHIWLSMHCHTALCTYIHTHLANYALQDNHMQTQTHSANQACTHKTTGFTYTVAQPCASTYAHIWLSMHYTTTTSKHKHNQIHTHARTK